MRSTDDTILSTPAQLAREWRMYEAVEAGEADALYATWEAPAPVVVVGRGNRLDDWVRAERCRLDGIEVLRRCSGGGAVVLGPGCLNYAVCLSLESRPALADVPGSFRAVHGHLIAALAVPRLTIAGVADLVWRGRKVSGNAQRRGRRALLHHGTLLYGFDPGLADRYLRDPPRQPAYRSGRPHGSFMGNLPISAEEAAARVASALDVLAHASISHSPEVASARGERPLRPA